MRLYADRARLVAPRHVAQALRECVGEVSTLPAGPARHAALAALLVDAGGLAQGVADAERDAAGADVFGVDALRRVAAGATLEGPEADDPVAGR